MSKYYEVKLSVEDLSKLAERYRNISGWLSRIEFKQFLLDKCIKMRDEVMKEHLYSSSIDDDETHNNEKVTLYESGNHEEIDGNTITLYNDSVIDIENTDTFFNEEYRNAFYPSELSLAELVEYGAGLVGAESSLGTGDEWDYMTNSYRDYGEGWYYKNGGEAQHTQGSEGKYIYYYLKEEIEKNIEDWVDEYLSERLERWGM